MEEKEIVKGGIMKKKIAILTGGGDCPGLNAVIRAVAKKSILEHNIEVFGFEDGYEGLIHNKVRPLSYSDVSGILTLGGTILGTSNRANPYKYYKDGKVVDISSQAIKNFHKNKFSCLIAIGGDGTLSIAHKLFKDGIPIIGVPKTIDNDIKGTDITFGFDSAVRIATEAIDCIHTTAQSHHRAMVIEVMGRGAGWIALYSGAAGGADIILIPEIPYDIETVCNKVKERSKKGKRFSIIVIAEGAKAKGGEVFVRENVQDPTEPKRLGGVGFWLGEEIERRTAIETRTVVIGHLQRGGSPSYFDRILGTELGAKAVDLVLEGKFGYMVAVKNSKITYVSLDKVAGGSRVVPVNHRLIKATRSVGVIFGSKEL